MKTVIIVTGGRDYADAAMVSDVLETLKPDLVVQGGASGADTLAHEWANEYSQSLTFKADWKSFGKLAGPMRNAAMLDAYPDAIVVAFPGGKGTESCVELAKKRNMIVLRVEA